jgi:hypothetical protein
VHPPRPAIPTNACSTKGARKSALQAAERCHQPTPNLRQHICCHVCRCKYSLRSIAHITLHLPGCTGQLGHLAPRPHGGKHGQEGGGSCSQALPFGDLGIRGHTCTRMHTCAGALCALAAAGQASKEVTQALCPRQPADDTRCRSQHTGWDAGCSRIEWWPHLCNKQPHPQEG